MAQGKLTDARYEELKQEVLFLFEETCTDTYPIDPFAIAKKLKYVVRAYSQLEIHEYFEAICISNDGFSRVELDPITGMYQYVIYYNDENHSLRRIRWTIFHEIGHIYLGHHDNPAGNEGTEESEANFFAKYASAPPPLVGATHCNGISDVYDVFMLSEQAAEYAYEYYMKWLHYGPRFYLPYEEKLLTMFHLAVA